MTKTTIRYEQEPCSRCGGTGQYSFNSVNGTNCFGCMDQFGRGTGLRITKAAARSREKVQEFKASILSIPVEELEPGMGAIVLSHRGRVQSVEPDQLNEGRVRVAFKKMTVNVEAGTTVIRQATDEEWAQITEFAASLPGVEIVEKP